MSRLVQLIILVFVLSLASACTSRERGSRSSGLGPVGDASTAACDPVPRSDIVAWCEARNELDNGICWYYPSPECIEDMTGRATRACEAGCSAEFADFFACYELQPGDEPSHCAIDGCDIEDSALSVCLRR